jgi:hypothetical protein
MLYMVIEHFKGGDAKPVYRRFRDRGRLMPDGLAYVDSWVTSDCARCFQIVRCDDPALLQIWAEAWADLIDFELHPVRPSKDAYEALKPQLYGPR